MTLPSVEAVNNYDKTKQENNLLFFFSEQLIIYQSSARVKLSELNRSRMCLKVGDIFLRDRIINRN